MAAFEEAGNYILGAGRILFALEGTNEYRYIVETPELTINVTTEVVDLWGSDTPVSQKIASSEAQREYAGSFAAHDIDADNLAIFFGGENTTVTNSSVSSIVDYEVTVKQGRTYRIGKDASNPRGFRGVSNVVVTGDTGSPTYVVDDDYVVDARRGLITIINGGGIADDTLIEISCDVDDGEYVQVASTGAASIRGSLIFMAENTDGVDVDYEFPNVILRADGDFSLKSRDEYQGLSFAMEINEDETGRAIYGEFPFVAAP